MLEDQTLKSLIKEGGQIVVTQYLKGVYGFSDAIANRFTALVDMAGGWQVVVDRSQQQLTGIRGEKEKK
ncbi:hypothetical protein [Glaciimonas sp. PCH181]|uniref:hypothetical protein n=1 Tax=Glaciimonas sp. PCH181 TaxID=2133943 RepID=UPI000D35C2A4|nr:hypothetical protein [Glaciimonas sp. PCH181]PUA18095.1 hypothetical protein C7W93_19920 [Glaciimonas sp. PCH181]